MSQYPNINSPSEEVIKKACDALLAGKLVSFPTETVYGLGADATNDKAVAGIFEAKGRPSFNPLIVHVPSLEIAETLVEFDELARKVAEKFWPGPLTLVLPRKKECPISELASAGLPTLAIRVPANQLARDLLTSSNLPVAAPSANPSGQLSPTMAEHVAKGLGDKVTVILDGGACGVGLESTVAAVHDGRITILRPGAITEADFSGLTANPVAQATEESDIVSPGMLLSHYAPSCPVRLNATSVNKGETFVGFGPGFNDIEESNLSPSSDLREAAANLFKTLHRLDEENAQSIAIAPIPETGLGIAINDRLKRAAAPRG